ncbi:hypothetical protein PZA11_002285 [Diplocarpon coronariae]|uniref:Uncharacterized protein n=1 Tax=Diplocarpon coronariae TaxID=2795749 RepID=A0A218ZEW7_9HELO|nr:hypothetical protein JHW43_006482 [Diplocarpon mali]OWP06567.1 hypothetical protein B2J93_1208 [Marssonina coronariae]
MPPTSDQEIKHTLSSSPQPNIKLSQRAAGIQIPTKNGRKNGAAKDGSGGGVLLTAVSKNTAKSPNAKPQANRTQSPDIKSTSSPSNGNPVTSPLLDALSSAALDRSPAQNTTEWTRSIPTFSSSPNNLINLGESPPASHLEDRLVNFGWTTREQRVPGQISSASPPSRRRPHSYQIDSNFPQGIDDQRSQVSAYAARRSSMYSQHSRYHPPLPHQVQAHFYGAPDANLIMSPPTPGLTPGENGFHSGFDSLPTTNHASKLAEDVIVNGYEGGVNIYTVSKRGLSKISGIEGLRGGVFNAKILPWTGNGGSAHLFPLIAVVVHGPVLAFDNSSTSTGDTPPSEGLPATQNGSVRGSPKIHGRQLDESEPIGYYQTTVEVYSLSMKAHVATLLSLPKTALTIPTTSPSFRAPLPVGSLTIRAESGNIVVGSGVTGETWLFCQGDVENPLEKFRCIGKVWATVQNGVIADAGGLSATDEWHTSEQPSVRKQYKASTLSMNGRWLAYCPSAPSSQISLRATVPGSLAAAKVPGLSSHAPPNLPGVNCTVDSPGGESVVKQIVQLGTQKFIEAGNYLTQQGLSAWNNYRSKPFQNQSATVSYQTHANFAHQFPPTHGLQAPAPLVTKDPGLISILDLEILSQHASSTGSSPHPLATFRVPHGCSFLSFAPNGLALFTASNKGDIQFVWDLMRIQFAKSSFLKGTSQGTGSQGPHVRQIAQFSRMTIARIVDVVWTSPHGERAAMVTEPGTIHVLDLPASAFSWPPPRRRVQSPKSDESAADANGPALTATGVATSAVNSFWTAARPLVSSRPRRSSMGISARTVTAQAGHGTQAFAAGISRSVGAATGKMNEMRKSANTKLHLPKSHSAPSRACVLLLNSKRNDSVVVLGGGVVRFYTIKNRRADRPADKQKASRGAKFVEFRLPSLPDFNSAPELTRDFNQVGVLELTERDVDESRWKARQSPPPTAKVHGTESSIPQAEIESNAPYQPFHTDKRVSLHVYADKEIALLSPSVSALISAQPADVKKIQASHLKTAWAFGGSITATKLDVGPSHNPDDDFDLPDPRTLPSSSIERISRVTDSTENMEQIVITTRIRSVRAGPGNTGDGDGEGFFEDDCDVLDFASQRV